MNLERTEITKHNRVSDWVFFRKIEEKKKRANLGERETDRNVAGLASVFELLIPLEIGASTWPELKGYRATSPPSLLLVCTSGVEKHGRPHEDLTNVAKEPIGKQQARLFLGFERDL